VRTGFMGSGAATCACEKKESVEGKRVELAGSPTTISSQEDEKKENGRAQRKRSYSRQGASFNGENFEGWRGDGYRGEDKGKLSRKQGTTKIKERED